MNRTIYIIGLPGLWKHNCIVDLNNVHFKINENCGRIAISFRIVARPNSFTNVIKKKFQ